MDGEALDSVQLNPSEEQKKILLKNFQYQPFPKDDLLAKLSTDTGLPLQSIQIWFSEKRKLLKIKEDEAVENSPEEDDNISENSLEEEEDISENQELMQSWMAKFQEQNKNEEEEEDDTDEDEKSEKNEEQMEDLSLKKSQMVQISEKMQHDSDIESRDAEKVDKSHVSIADDTIEVSRKEDNIGIDDIDSRDGGSSNKDELELSEEATILKDQEKHDVQKESESFFIQENESEKSLPIEEKNNLEKDKLEQSIKIFTFENKIQESGSADTNLDLAVKRGKLDKIINMLRESEVTFSDLVNDSEETKDSSLATDIEIDAANDYKNTIIVAPKKAKEDGTCDTLIAKNNSIKQDGMSIQEAFDKAHLYNDLKIKYDKLLESYNALKTLNDEKKVDKSHVSMSDDTIEESTIEEESTMEEDESSMEDNNTISEEKSLSESNNEEESTTLNETIMKDMSTLEIENRMINASSLVKEKSTMDESSMGDESTLEGESTLEESSSIEETFIVSQEEGGISVYNSSRDSSTPPPGNDLTSTFSPTDGSTPINPKSKAPFKINNPHSLIEIPEETINPEQTEFMDASSSMYFAPPIHSTMNNEAHHDASNNFPETAPPPHFPNYPQFPYPHQQVPAFPPYAPTSYPEYGGQMYYNNPPYGYPPPDQIPPYYNYPGGFNPYPYYNNPNPIQNNPEQFGQDPRLPDVVEATEEIKGTQTLQPAGEKLASLPIAITQIHPIVDQNQLSRPKTPPPPPPVKVQSTSGPTKVTENFPPVKDIFASLTKIKITSGPAKVIEKPPPVRETTINLITPVKKNAKLKIPEKNTVIQPTPPFRNILSRITFTKTALPVQGKISTVKPPASIEKSEKNKNGCELMTEHIQESEATLDEHVNISKKKSEGLQNVERKKGSRYIWKYEEGLPKGWKTTNIKRSSMEAPLNYFLNPDGITLRSKKAVIKYFLGDPKITTDDIEKFKTFYMNDKRKNSKKEASKKQKNPPSIGLSISNSKKQKIGQ